MVFSEVLLVEVAVLVDVEGEGEVAEEAPWVVAFHLLAYRLCHGVEVDLVVNTPCPLLYCQQVLVATAVFLEISLASLMVFFRQGFPDSLKAISVDYFSRWVFQQRRPHPRPLMQ